MKILFFFLEFGCNSLRAPKSKGCVMVASSSLRSAATESKGEVGRGLLIFYLNDLCSNTHRDLFRRLTFNGQPNRRMNLL